jgi:cytochrome c oxidase subunit 3
MNTQISNLSRTQFQAQPFHLVTPSPWPLLTSFTLFILTSGTVMYFNGYANPLGGSGIILVAIGFITTVASMTLWFRDVVTEGTFLGDHTFAVQQGITIGVGLFILSEVFFFVSVF